MTTDTLSYRGDGTPTDVPEGWLTPVQLRLAGLTNNQIREIRLRQDPSQMRRTAAPVGPSTSPWFYNPAITVGVVAPVPAIEVIDSVPAVDPDLIPRRIEGYSTRECIGTTRLKERGWTPAHIKRLLGDPDAELDTGRRNRAHLWAVERIEEAEKSDAALQKRLAKFRGSEPTPRRRTKPAPTAAEIRKAEASARAQERWWIDYERRQAAEAAETAAIVARREVVWAAKEADKKSAADAAKAEAEAERAAFLAGAVTVAIPPHYSPYLLREVDARARAVGARRHPEGWSVPTAFAAEIQALVAKVESDLRARVAARQEAEAAEAPKIEGCHYCGCAVTATGAFGEPVCDDCGGLD